MNDEAVPQRTLGIYSRRGAEGVLIETYHDAYVLNATGEFIWQQVGTGATVAAVVTAVADHFGVEMDQARSAVEAFLTTLSEKGFVEYA